MKFPGSTAQHTIFNLTVIGVIAAVLAALAEALQTPLAKLLSADTGVLMSVSFFFLGSACGMLIILLFGRKTKAIFDPDRHIRKKDTGKIIASILFAFLSFTLIIFGIQQETAATASVLQNITTVATVLFAALFLKEKIPKWLGIGVALIVLGSLALAVTNPETISFSTGSLLIIGGCIFSGALSIVLKLLAERNPAEIIIIRGFAIGIIVFIAALCAGESLPSVPNALGFMVVGFIGGGISPLFLMYGQRYLGAAKSAAIFGIYPLLGVLLAIPLLGEIPSASLLAALILFIPGMYFVIMKNRNPAALKAEETEKTEGGDVQFFTSVSESTKTGIRNHVTSFGFLIISLFFIMMMINLFSPEAATTIADTIPTYIPGIIFGIIILICGILLLVLGKRVMAAVTFILMVPQMLATAVLDGLVTLNILSGIFAIIFAFILMTSKDPQKYAFAIVNILLGIASVSCIFDRTVCGWIMAVSALYLLWLSIACGAGKLRFSISKYLTGDSEMTFGRCGPVIGYLLIAIIMVITVVFEYVDRSFFIYSDAILFLGLIDAGLLILLGILLIIIGKRKATSFLFIGCGVALVLDMLTSGAFVYLPMILMLVLGIQNILRGDPRILPSALLIGYAFIIMLYGQLTEFPEVLTAMLLLTAMCAAVALYLSFAVFAEKPKLPLF